MANKARKARKNQGTLGAKARKARRRVRCEGTKARKARNLANSTTSGTESIGEGKNYYVKAKKMMAESGFDLRKWKANSRELQIFFDNKEAPIECNNKIVDDLSYLDT